MKSSHSLAPVKKSVEELAPATEIAPSAGLYDYGVENQEDGKTQLLEYWRSVRKHLWLVLGIVLLGTVLASVYAARQPDIYEATARVQVDLEQNPMKGVATQVPIFVNNPTNDPIYFTTQLQILSSPSLLRRVARSLNLETDKEFLGVAGKENASTWQLVLRMFGLSKRPAPPQSDPMQDRLGASGVATAVMDSDPVEAKRMAPYVGMLRSLGVEPVRDNRMGYARETRLVDIKFQHNNPRVAARVVNAVADVYVTANDDKKNRTGTDTNKFLQERIAEVQNSIRELDQKKLNYARDKDIISLTGEENTVVERLSGLNQQLLTAENTRKEAEAAYNAHKSDGAVEAKVDAGEKQANTEVNGQIADFEGKLVVLQQKRAELLEEYTPEWPEVKQVETQIGIIEQNLAQLRARAASARTRIVSSIKTNYEVAYRQALEKEQSLRRAYETQRAQAQTQNQSAITYNIIQQEIETNKTLLNGLFERQKEFAVGKEVTPNNVSVIDYALASEAPIGPRRLRSVLSAFILSLALGLGLALAIEYFNDTVRSVEDVERNLRLPALAVIPGLESAGRRLLASSKSALQRRDGSGRELLINSDKRSPLAEAYRHLRTSVLLSTAGHAPKTLMITSSVPSEGKTTTAVNLAASLAQTSASVLVIDADMRRPRLHSIFNVSNHKGLSTILASSCSEADMLALVQQDEATQIYLLPSGRIPPNPAELLGSDQMRRLLQTFSNTFTHVIIDTPPTASFTDSVLVSSLVDGVLLVVHGGRSSRSVVNRAKHILQNVGAKIVGVVLNNVDVRSNDYYYYYQQYYYKSYYSEEPEEEEEVENTASVGK